MPNNFNLEEAWKETRSGARAGAGFRFQDAATVFALTLCWNGDIAAESATPESLDDFALESLSRTIWVQVKSKIQPSAKFHAREIADIVLSGPGSRDDRRVLLFDRSVLDYSNRDWNVNAADQPNLLSAILGAASSSESRTELRGRLTASTIITVSSPLADSIALVKDKLKIGEGAATVCIHSLLHQVGVQSSRNARSSFASRHLVSVGDVESIFADALNLVDSETINEAFRLGLARFIDFRNPVVDPQYYEGVATRAAHVAAGLVMPRDNDVGDIVGSILSGRHVLVCGPSGSGKSALCYLAAFETRHALRWIEATSMTDAEWPILLRCLRAQSPSLHRPLVVYIDDVGRGGSSLWPWLVDQARHTAGLRVVGSVREEDVGILSALDEVTVRRPALSAGLAEEIWARLSETGATKAAFWKEAFEISNGLMLEYIHILTQGERLNDVIFEQIRRRVQENRHNELAVLPFAAAAGMYGARVSKTALLTQANITEKEFGALFLRLRNEHLIGTSEGGLIGGLHELRSRAIHRSVCDLLSLCRREATIQAFQCVASADARRFSTGVVRDATVNVDEFIDVAILRLNREPDPNLLVGTLEALRLIAADSDAETFKTIAEDFNLSHRQYILALVFLTPNVVGEGTDSSPVLRHMHQLIAKFQSKRAKDRRAALLTGLSPNTLAIALHDIEALHELLPVLIAMQGIAIGELARPVLERVKDVAGPDKIDEIAEVMAILNEGSSADANEVAEIYGGSKRLLNRLWRETPWAVEISAQHNDDGTVRLIADILSVTEELQVQPDRSIFDYGAVAIHLCPSAYSVLSRPLPISGEVIEIDGYTPGLKNLDRRNVRSKASIMWDRLLLFAVVQKFGAASRTQVLERHRYGLKQASAQLSRAADRFCRGRRMTRRQINEAKALSVLEDLLPPPPVGPPEILLDDPLSREIGDPAGNLIVDIAQAIQRLGEGRLIGTQLAHEMESIADAVTPVQTDVNWSYVDGGPQSSLDEIGRTARSLRRVGLAIGRRETSEKSLVLPSGRHWANGKGWHGH